MSEEHGILGRFAAEIRRRHVGRVAIGYAAVAFVLLQAAEIVLPAFDLPEWGLRAVVVFAFLGFPVALALAWIYDITPQGIERTPDHASGAPEVSVMPRLAFLVVTIAVSTGAGWWFLRATVPDGSSTNSTAPQARAPAELVAAAYEPGTPITSLAVLPLDDFSEGSDQDYFVAGMHEALVSALSQLDGVRVISRTTVIQYDRTSKSMPQIAQELGVDGVVEGSVLRADDQVRITVQLIHAPSDSHVWSESYEAQFANIIALQGDVATDIAAEVLQELNLATDAVPTMAAAELDPEVREEFMKGRYEQSQGTSESLQRAVDHFEAAIALDSTFAPAFAALGSTVLLLGDMPGVVDVDLTVAEDAAARALELDQESPEALAVITATAPDPAAPPPPRGGGAGASTRVERAREIQHRSSLDALDSERREAWVAQLSSMGGEAAIPIIRKAMEMGRVPEERRVEVAHVLVASGHTDEAIDVLEDMVDEWPDAAPAWSALERTHAARGDFDEAVDVRVTRMIEVEGRDEEVAHSLEEAYDQDGEYGYWEWCRADLERQLAAGEPVGPADLATTYAALGESELAIEWLRRAVETRDPGLLAIRNDPVWDAYRDNPEFRAIAREIRGRQSRPDRRE